MGALRSVFIRVHPWFHKSQRLAPTHDINEPLLTPEEIIQLIEHADALRRAHQHGRLVFFRHPGDARSVHLGRGLDFEEVRAYQAGDDIRNMDWRTTARMGEPFLKVYREEHHPALHLMIDRTASMRFGTRRQLKVTQAVRTAIVAAALECNDHACVGGTLIDASPVALPCLPRQAGVLALARAAVAPCPPIAADDGAQRDAWLASLRRAALALPPGSRLLLLSDFHWLRADDIALLGHLAQRHEVSALIVSDPAERALPMLGALSFFDLAAQAARRVDTGQGAVRDHFARAAQRRLAHIAGWLAQAHVALFRISTADDVFEQFLRDG